MPAQARMKGAAMSTQPLERYVRICPDHRVEVMPRGETFVCPRDRREVDRWLVVDRQTRRVIQEGYASTKGEKKPAAAGRAKTAKKR
jgi:hypothetical protein